MGHEGQDHLPTRAKVLCLDWWLHSCFPLHLPSYVDHQAGIRRGRTIHRSPKVLLISQYFIQVLGYSTSSVAHVPALCIFSEFIPFFFHVCCLIVLSTKK